MFLMLVLTGFLITAFLMVAAKRITALIRSFKIQSIFLFLYIFYMAAAQKHFELFVVSALILAFKTWAIPSILSRIVRRIKVEEDIGLIVNSQVSLVIALALAYLSYIFVHSVVPSVGSGQPAAFVVSIATLCIGFFIMVSRMKALGQVLGLLVMENGIFLAAAAVIGGMPFFVEVAFFFDVFVLVVIVEVFVYRVNSLFTHIDASKMNSLKG